jgi:hypothetical protein
MFPKEDTVFISANATAFLDGLEIVPLAQARKQINPA